MASDEYGGSLQLQSISSPGLEFGVGNNWVTFKIKDPEKKIIFNGFFQKQVFSLNSSSEWELGVIETDGFFFAIRSLTKKAQNKWAEEEEIFCAKIGHQNNLGKFRIDSRIGVVNKTQKSRMSCEEVRIIPIKIGASLPISNNGEIQGWTTCSLKKSCWDEVGMMANIGYSPIKSSGLNIGLTGKSQLFNSEVYSSLCQRNELGVQIGYDCKLFSPYFIYQQILGKPKNDVDSKSTTIGSNIVIKKLKSNIARSYDHGNKMTTIKYSAGYPALGGNICLSANIQRADWMKKNNTYILSFQFGGINRKEEYKECQLYNDPINLCRTLELVPDLEDAKNIINTPRKAVEMMKGISYTLNLDKPESVYEKKSGDCWSQNNLFSNVLTENGYESYVLFYAPFGSSDGHAFSIVKNARYWCIYEYGETWTTNVPSKTPVEMAAKRILLTYLSTKNVRRAIQPNSGEWISFFWQESTEKKFYDSVPNRVWGEPFQFKKSSSPLRQCGVKEVDENGWFEK
ncbi:MAG: hypothetical protein Q7T79_03080 [bacterium]|nr:hypothetical protein [bacterium]